MLCYCDSQQSYETCCKPLLEYEQPAPTAERLMRSRYSAYKTGRFRYILNTYSKDKRAHLSEEALAQSATGTQWLKLEVCNSSTDTVEFKAWFSENKKLGLMHETSSFIQEDGNWRYVDGQMHDDTGTVKIGRNDPCFCGSGKKFKQCCMRALR